LTTLVDVVSFDWFSNITEPPMPTTTKSPITPYSIRLFIKVSPPINVEALPEENAQNKVIWISALDKNTFLSSRSLTKKAKKRSFFRAKSQRNISLASFPALPN
jgi:hypothetical protein